jgi:ribonuclease HIII
MAAKSMTVRADAPDVLARLRRFADSPDAYREQPLQNGHRVFVRRGGATLALNVYPSKDRGCKVVFDRPDDLLADEVAALLGATPSAPRTAKAAAGAVEPALPDVAAWVGSDESGKGDYFGPLVVGAVALTAGNWRVALELGVRDSKSLTDARASALARELRAAFPCEVVTIMPPRYNELRASMGSVNRVLAWAHARAIEEVLARAPEAEAVVADQFGDESLIRDALKTRGRTVRLVQMHRAERDPAVAAASILARAEFLRRLDALGRQAGLRLPKGASSAVDAAARALVASRGEDALRAVAKLHFRTTGKARG